MMADLRYKCDLCKDCDSCDEDDYPLEDEYRSKFDSRDAKPAKHGADDDEDGTDNEYFDDDQYEDDGNIDDFPKAPENDDYLSDDDEDDDGGDDDWWSTDDDDEPPLAQGRFVSFKGDRRQHDECYPQGCGDEDQHHHHDKDKHHGNDCGKDGHRHDRDGKHHHCDDRKHFHDQDKKHRDCDDENRKKHHDGDRRRHDSDDDDRKHRDDKKKHRDHDRDHRRDSDDDRRRHDSDDDDRKHRDDKKKHRDHDRDHRRDSDDDRRRDGSDDDDRKHRDDKKKHRDHDKRKHHDDDDDHHRHRDGDRDQGRKCDDGDCYRKRMTCVRMPTSKKFFMTLPVQRKDRQPCKAKTRLVTLRNGGRGAREYTIVTKEMEKTLLGRRNRKHTDGIRGFQFVKVQKVVNCCLWRRFRHCQKKIYKQQGFVNEKMLFFGTPRAKDIVENGMHWDKHSQYGVFGRALYFAKHSSVADRYVFSNVPRDTCKRHNRELCSSCKRKIILCRVALGREKTETSKKRFDHVPRGYDSVLGKPSRSLRYQTSALWTGAQVYPEFVITYRIKSDQK